MAIRHTTLSHPSGTAGNVFRHDEHMSIFTSRSTDLWLLPFKSSTCARHPPSSCLPAAHHHYPMTHENNSFICLEERSPLLVRCLPRHNLQDFSSRKVPMVYLVVLQSGSFRDTSTRGALQVTRHPSKCSPFEQRQDTKDIHATGPWSGGTQDPRDTMFLRSRDAETTSGLVWNDRKGIPPLNRQAGVHGIYKQVNFFIIAYNPHHSSPSLEGSQTGSARLGNLATNF